MLIASTFTQSLYVYRLAKQIKQSRANIYVMALWEHESMWMQITAAVGDPK